MVFLFNQSHSLRGFSLYKEVLALHDLRKSHDLMLHQQTDRFANSNLDPYQTGIKTNNGAILWGASLLDE